MSGIDTGLLFKSAAGRFKQIDIGRDFVPTEDVMLLMVHHRKGNAKAGKVCSDVGNIDIDQFFDIPGFGVKPDGFIDLLLRGPIVARVNKKCQKLALFFGAHFYRPLSVFTGKNGETAKGFNIDFLFPKACQIHHLPCKIRFDVIGEGVLKNNPVPVSHFKITVYSVSGA